MRNGANGSKLSRRAAVGQVMQSWYGDEADTGNAARCGMWCFVSREEFEVEGGMG